ncbi:hypothetical protein [Algoriphagus sp.]|uniref:hypothetical protein n=1 Tax=Algoriphagus sp. TaxID=1872435 RepID=UPI0026364839|nr:hypothetical protein [Algoriphagus sp.]
MSSPLFELKFSRIFSLLRYDWTVYKWIYSTLIATTIAILVILYLVVLYANSGYMTLESGFVQGLFFSGFFVLSLLWTGNSFWPLRNSRRARSYLLLPASNLEKYLSEFVIKVFGLGIVYPLVFWVASNMGLGLFRALGPMTLPGIQLNYIGFLSFTEFWVIRDLGSQLNTVKVIVIGLLAMIPSLMWVGSLIFGKYNLLGMPLVLFISYLILTGTSLGLSWMMNPGTLIRNGQSTVEMLKFDQPEIFAETPLFLLMCAIWIWMAVILSYIVGYVKLTEKQV